MIQKINVDKHLRIVNTDIKKYLDMPVISTIMDFDEDSSNKLREDLNCALESGQKVFPVIIDSYGGYIYELLGMISILKQSTLPIITICDTKAISCGAILFSCGIQRIIGSNATVLLHEASTSIRSSKMSEVMSDANESKRLNALIFKHLAINCNKPLDYFINLMRANNNADLILTPQDCLDHGIATAIGDVTYETSINVEHKLTINTGGLRI